MARVATSAARAATGRLLDLGVEDLRPVEVPQQAVQGVPGLVGVALDALGGGVEGADQSLADQPAEVLQGGVADEVEHLVHQAVAELVERVFLRMGAGILQEERLRLVVGERFGRGGEGLRGAWESPWS